MSFFIWDDQYSVNVWEMDEQHKKLVTMLNDLFEAMLSGKGRETLGKVLTGLISYTRIHFAAEEELMKKNGFPEYPIHKKEHDALTQKVLELDKRFRTSTVSITVETGNFLKDWLTHHILHSAKKYGQYLDAKGIK